MTQPNTLPLPGNDAQEQMSFNRSIRNIIIQKKVGNDGSNIDHMDSKDLKVVLTALKDQDSQALSQQRLQLENKAVDDAAQRAKELIPHLYNMLGQNPGTVPVDLQAIDPSKIPLPFVPPDDPSRTFEVVDTMLEVGSTDESYNQFMDRTNTRK